MYEVNNSNEQTKEEEIIYMKLVGLNIHRLKINYLSSENRMTLYSVAIFVTFLIFNLL